MSSTYLFSTLLFLLHQTSSAPIETCDQQIPCLSVDYSLDTAEENDRVKICMVFEDDPDDGLVCIKEDAISFACPVLGSRPNEKTSGFGDTYNCAQLCVVGDCYYDVNDGAGDPDWQPIPAEKRYVEFGFKDGQGCGGQDADCVFNDDPLCGNKGQGDCIDAGDSSIICCDPDSGTCSGEVCCQRQTEDYCAADADTDPTWQQQCRGATNPEGAVQCDTPDPEELLECDYLCAGGNRDECIHRIYYDCPEPCDTNTPTTAPPQTAPSPTPCPGGGDAICTCPLQDPCMKFTLGTVDSDTVTLLIEYNGGADGCIKGEAPSNMCFEAGDAAPECDCVAGTDCTTNCGTYTPPGGDYPDVFKLENMDDAFDVTLTRDCDAVAAQNHFHVSAKDSAGCTGSVEVTGTDGTTGYECIGSAVTHEFCLAGKEECLWTVWYCQECPLYVEGSLIPAEIVFTDACIAARAADPHLIIPGYDLTHSPTRAGGGNGKGSGGGNPNAMLNEGEDDENIFGLENASKSETAGLFSFIVIGTSVMSVIIALSIYGYIMRKRRNIEKEMIEPMTPNSPPSRESVESNPSEQSIEVVANDTTNVSA